MLHRVSAGARADFPEQRFARVTIVAEDAYLDQFVVREAAVDFRHDAVGEPVAAYDHHGLERVRAGPEHASFCRDRGCGYGCGYVVHRMDSR